MSLVSKLTRRQREIAALMAHGLSDKDVIYKMKIGETTFRAERKVIFLTLGIDSRTALLRFFPPKRGRDIIDLYAPVQPKAPIDMHGVVRDAVECRAINLIALGRRNPEIASEIGISREQANSLVRAMTMRAKLENRTQLGRWWIANAPVQYLSSDITQCL